MSGWKVRTENWLAGIGEMTDTYIHLSDLNGLTLEAAQSAVDATYGKGYARLNDHGTVIWGTHLLNQRAKLLRPDPLAPFGEPKS